MAYRQELSKHKLKKGIKHAGKYFSSPHCYGTPRRSRLPWTGITLPGNLPERHVTRLTNNDHPPFC